MPVTLYDFSDRQMLRIINDVATDPDVSKDGKAYVGDISERILPSEEKATANRNVGARCAWLRKFGVIDWHDGHKWTLTAKGKELMIGELSEIQKGALDQADGAAAITLATELAKRQKRYASRNGNSSAGQLMRRTWQRETHIA